MTIQVTIHRDVEGYLDELWTQREQLPIKAFNGLRTLSLKMIDPATPKTYIVHESGYYDNPPEMYEFCGTYRQLLLKLGGFDESKVTNLTNEDLQTILSELNGDGCSAIDVWCVEDHQWILG